MQTRDGFYINILVHHVSPGDTVQPKNDAFTLFVKQTHIVFSFELGTFIKKTFFCII